ncbi:MAG: VOC family protein [Candidatus Heimdallarchaeota archaeon]|nr:VOC family protein [Candidatus Heimdallarchaeota archaeon]
MLKYIAHVVVYTKNMKQAMEFYTNMLGCEVEFETPSYTQLSINKSQTKLGLHMLEGFSFDGVATEVSFAVQDVREAQRQLEGRGIQFERDAIEISPNTWVANFKDLDGNNLSIYSYATP